MWKGKEWGLEWGLPEGYWVMEDPDLLTLRRDDGSVVAPFSAHGADPEEVRRTAEEDDRGGR